MIRSIASFLIASFFFMLMGCGDSGQPGAAPPRSAGRSATTAPAQATTDKQLNLYIWAEYLPQDVIDDFTKQTGIKVNVDNYDSNETLLQKLQSGVADYDLCVPSDYMIEILVTEKLVQPIDRAAIPNLSNIDPRFMDRPFDPGNKHSVPYLWGTTGLGYNVEAVGGAIDSWSAVFDPRFKGKILMLDDMRECFGAALKSMGKSLNSTDEATLRTAGEILKKQKPLVKTYNSNDFDNILAAEDVVIAHGYNGQLAKLAAKFPSKFAFVIPKEGATLSQDGLCIPAKASHVQAAQAFINFIHDPQINARIVNGTSYPSTNTAARPHIKPEILNNPAIYPPDALLKNCEAVVDLGDVTTLMDRLWNEVKAE